MAPAGATAGAGFPGAGAGMQGMSEQEQAMVKAMHAAMESCPVKTVISGTMGFGLGGVFGLFMASVCSTSYPNVRFPTMKY